MSEDLSPSFTDLLDWVEGRADEAVASRVAAAVGRGDQRAVGIVEWIRTFHRSASEMSLATPPPLVRQNLRLQFARRMAGQPGGAPDFVDGELAFDSRRDLSRAGTRGAPGDSDGVHLMFRTDPADVLIDLYPMDPQTVRMDGRVLASDADLPPIFEAIVLAPQRRLRDVDGDELGQFHFEQVPRDATELQVTNQVVAVRMPLDLVDVG
jgi:hypothetical protein